MKVITNPSNIQLVTELCKKNPDSSYAKILNFNKETGEIGNKDLSIFTEQPDIANEFIADMANKIVVQRAFDIFKDYEMPFKVFLKEMGKLGDAEELLSCKLATPSDYDATVATNSPFDAKKPDIILSWIKTQDKKVVDVRLAYDICAGAFVNEGSLSNIAGIILKNLQDSVENMLYDKIRADLSDETLITPSAEIQVISGAGEVTNAQKAYEQIITLVNKMSLPSTAYNTSGVKTLTKKGTAVLVLNATYMSSFDVNVLASLFNSGAIDQKKYFSEVILAEMSGDENQIGVILDKEAYLWGYRFQVTQSIVNPKTLEICTYYHAWIKRGFVPFRNGVRLIVEPTEPVGE